MTQKANITFKSGATVTVEMDDNTLERISKTFMEDHTKLWINGIVLNITEVVMIERLKDTPMNQAEG